MEIYDGIVNDFRFHDEENDYTVLRLKTEKTNIIVTGYFPGVKPGFLLHVEGKSDEHPKYGNNLSITRWIAELPQKRYDVINFLTNLIIENYPEQEPENADPFECSTSKDDIQFILGKVYDKYRDKTYEIIRNNYLEIMSCHFDLESNGKYSTLPAQLNNALKHNDLLLDIAKELVGVDAKLAQFSSKILSCFYGHPDMQLKGDVIYHIQSNPFVFCHFLEEDGFEFPQADLIAEHFGLSADSEDRFEAGIKYAYKEVIFKKGHVYAKPQELLDAADRILQLEKRTLVNGIQKMIDKGELVRDKFDEDSIYLKKYYEMEYFIAEKLTRISQQNYDNAYIEPDFSEINNRLQFNLDDYQQNAISDAINSPISIITGGPGTGKTTIIRGIVAALQDNGITSISLAAPTGRAALRMKKATGVNAQTIHMLLNITPKSTREEVQEIPSSVFIIDEASMIDIDLMDKLVKALPLHAKLILVGDIDQLPSVNPGYILHDLIESNNFMVVRLTQTYRQAENSMIVTNAKRVINGKMIEDVDVLSGTDCVLLNVDDRSKAEDEACRLFSLLARYSNPETIQVLSSVKDNIGGTVSLNKKIQESINHSEETFETIDGTIIKTNDRVMVNRNDYTNRVFNGEISINCKVIIDEENKKKKLRLTFDDIRVIEYQEKEPMTKWLSLAYAITVHKSQGSEYPCVIFIVGKKSYRNLIYTAITRAKESLFIVGTLEDLKNGIDNVEPTKRNTKLTERIRYLNNRA